MSQRETDILLYVEHVTRELDVACALKHVLRARHGIQVEIESYIYDLPKSFERWSPRVVALPFTYAGATLPELRQVISAFPSASFVDMAYEQLYHRLNESFRVPQDDFPKRHVLHLAWGLFFSDFLTRNGVPREHVEVNGNLVYPLYRDPYRAFYPDRQTIADEYGLDAAKRWIFIPENYKAAFLPDSKFDAYVKQGADRDNINEYQAYDKESARQAIGWWHRAAALPDVEIIVRPRPATQCRHFYDVCRNLIGDFPSSFHVLKERSVREWILVSDAVVSSISTSLIEAAVAGKPAFMMTPLGMPDYLRMEWFDHIATLETEDAFMAVASGATRDDSSALRSWAEKTMMSRGDAIGNAASLLADVVRGERVVPSPPGDTFVASLSSPADAAREKPMTLRERLWVLRWRFWKFLKGAETKGRPPVRDETFDTASGGDKAFAYFEKDRFTEHDIAERVNRWEQVLA